MSQPKKKSWAGKAVWWIIFLIAVGLFIYAAYRLFGIFSAYKQGTDEYNELREHAVIQEEKPLEEGSQENTGEEDPGPVIDFASLQAVNEDVIGWLEVEALDISYPIVQGEDNDYYLHRTVKRTYNFAGSIFLAAENKSDFMDCHSIIYGHNMKNGSMFGTLRRFCEEETYGKSMYFWVCTPVKNYKYEIFSAQVAEVGGEAYTLFSAPDQQFKEYVDKMRSRSVIPVRDMEFKESNKVVTLSTCTGNDSTRFIVQGVRVN